MNSKKTASSAQVSNKTQPEEFDLVILGGGTGSTVAAWTFASEGKHVAVVDRKYIGGSCPNIACLPSKNIIHRAKVASYIRRSKRLASLTTASQLTWRSRTQTEDGTRPQRNVSGKLQKHWSRVHPRNRPVRPENRRGYSSRRDHPSNARRRRDRPYWYASDRHAIPDGWLSRLCLPALFWAPSLAGISGCAL
jgi:hypothetical protein